MSSDTIQVDIINSALAEFGATRIASLTEDTVERITATDIFAEVRDRLLADYSWNFAIKRKSLTPAAEQTPTSITYSGTTATVNLTAHGYSADMFVRIAGANQDPYNGDWLVASASTNSFTYVMDDTPTANASGTLTVEQVPGFEYDYLYTLPSDNLRILELYEPADLKYVIESNYLMCDEDEKIWIKYIKQVTDYTLWPPPARKCLALALAVKMSPKLRGVADVSTRTRLKEDLETELLRAYVVNAIEGNPNTPKEMQSLDKGNFSWQTER